MKLVRLKVIQDCTVNPDLFYIHPVLYALGRGSFPPLSPHQKWNLQKVSKFTAIYFGTEQQSTVLLARPSSMNVGLDLSFEWYSFSIL
jgi:hypothetical protein